MATEVLYVAEEHLLEVIKVIRAGLKATGKDRAITASTRMSLANWCDVEEAYIKRLEDDS